jgi:hypothetical protein
MLELWGVNEMGIGAIIIQQQEVKVRWLPCPELTTSSANAVACLIVMVATITTYALFL